MCTYPTKTIPKLVTKHWRVWGRLWQQLTHTSCCCFWFFYFLFFVFKTKSCYVAQVGPQGAIFLPPPPQSWDHSLVPPCLASQQQTLIRCVRTALPLNSLPPSTQNILLSRHIWSLSQGWEKQNKAWMFCHRDFLFLHSMLHASDLGFSFSSCQDGQMA